MSVFSTLHHNINWFKVCFSASWLSRLMTKPAKWLCAQGRLRSAWAQPVWSESSPCTQWVAKDPSFLHVDSKDSDETGRIPRLIWVFAGRTVILLVLSWGGSYVFAISFPVRLQFRDKNCQTEHLEQSKRKWLWCAICCQIWNTK